MVLRSGFLLIATRLQEAADMAHSNVRSMLSKAVQDAHPGKYAYYQDHTGDGESGDCIYGCDGDMQSAPYSISTVGGKHTANIDTSAAQKVQSVVSYKPMADDDDHYTAMESALKASNLYLELPLYERFISKKERDSASDDDFAGKGKSFPILKPSDVSAAVHAMGRAGSDNLGMAALKARIIAIAKRKGWTAELPKAWQDGSDSKESAEPKPAALKLSESAACEFLSTVKLSEASRTNYPIKVMSPGTGSSAHYPDSVVESAAKLVKPGTLMFWNHATQAEESQRPEGDLNNLAAIITKQGEWMPNGPKGPGIYAEAKVMSDYAQKVEERAPHIGVSIRASGTTSGKSVNGKPELKSIDHIESVDYVTKAGRGGLALAEAARNAGIEVQEVQGSEDMTDQEKAFMAKAEKFLLESEANKIASSALAGISLSEAGKVEVARRVMENIPTKGLGVIDEAKFKTLIETEAQNVGRFMSQMGYRGVTGMGQSGAGTTQLSEKQQRKALKEAKRQREALSEARTDIFAGIMGGGKAAEFAAKGRAA